MKKLWNEFKAFAFKGNVVDLAVGMMIGSAFTAIVTALVNSILMPLISLITGKVSFEQMKWVVGQTRFPTACSCRRSSISSPWPCASSS